MNEILKIQNVKKKYKDGNQYLEILEGVDLEVRCGETIAIIGKSGSGKSTLLNAIGLLDKIDEGEIYIQGIPTKNLSEQKKTWMRRKKIAFVFQNYHLMADFNILENVLIGLDISRGGGFSNENKMIAMKWLEKVDLENRIKHYPYQLSGGEQQRVAIARAVAVQPEILLCDEPTGNLDEVTGKKVLQYLLKIAKDTDSAMIMVTHDQEIARKADKIYKMENGVLIKV